MNYHIHEPRLEMRPIRKVLFFFVQSKPSNLVLFFIHIIQKLALRDWTEGEAHGLSLTKKIMNALRVKSINILFKTKYL